MRIYIFIIEVSHVTWNVTSSWWRKSSCVQADLTRIIRYNLGHNVPIWGPIPLVYLFNYLPHHTNWLVRNQPFFYSALGKSSSFAQKYTTMNLGFFITRHLHHLLLVVPDATKFRICIDLSIQYTYIKFSSLQNEYIPSLTASESSE